MKIVSAVTLCLAIVAPAMGNTIRPSVTIYNIGDSGVGDPIGSIGLVDSKAGLVLLPHLAALTPGLHGMHVHQSPDCSAMAKEGVMTAGLSAGGHLDPDQTGKHLGPDGAGHKGDLPALKVAADGTATGRLVASHLTLADLKGHAIMIHAGGDNYSDDPKPLGGGGARIACGVVN